MKIAHLVCFCLSFTLLACGVKKAENYVFPDHELPDPAGKTEPEEVPGGKPLFVWIDAAANFPEFANSKENIKRDLIKAKDVGFTDIVVDVRPTCGDILFKSSHCQQVEWLGAWKGTYQKFTRTADWDYLQAFIDMGHELGLKVHAGFNTMVGGGKSYLGSIGLLFRDSSKKDWATVLSTTSGYANCMDAMSGGTYFLNPANPDVQDYIISLLKDLAAYKDLDGIILDRCRFDGLNSDFSELTRTQFEKYVGATVNFTQDVMPLGKTGTVSRANTTAYKYLKAWFAYRSGVIHDFVAAARKAVKAVNPSVKFGVYVGGWYSTYYDVGVNWASPKYKASSDFFWANTDWDSNGFADQMDQMLIGAYASPGNVYGNSEWTMQGFCKLAVNKISGACPLVAGGPDVGNWDYENNYSDTQEHTAITTSVDACYNSCGGYFLFDLVHLRQGDLWSYVKAGISQYAK